MPTPAANSLTEIRRRRKLRQLDLAEKLGIRSTYLSQMETGSRPMPEVLVRRIQKLLNLSEWEADDLQAAAKISTRKYVIPLNASATEYELVHEFWKVLGRLHEDQIEVIKRVVRMTPRAEEIKN